MKKFVEILLSLKSMAALVFSGQIMIWAVIGTFFSKGDMLPLSFVWQALAVAVFAALWHFVTFTNIVIKRMRYSLRLALFSVAQLLMLAGFAYVFAWFPAGSFGAWLSFLLVYLVILGVTTAAYEIYNRITGKKYTARLERYRARQGE